MPWWPDTVSMGIAFGVVAVLVVSKTRSEREQNRRLWKAMKNLARHRDWIWSCLTIIPIQAT